MKFSKLVEFVSKKPIPPHVKHLVVEVMASDEEGEDVEVWSCYRMSSLQFILPFRYLSLSFTFKSRCIEARRNERKPTETLNRCTY
jgi:hypothetical protein